MRYLSLFSGIEAASVAWKGLGWTPVAFAEFEDFPQAVLKHHYPDVPDLGDVTKITEEQIKALGRIDVVVGGSPCQDLSMAGKRAGLRNEDGSITRSGLFDEQMRIFEIAREYCGTRYCLWENVPGAFSSNNGNDFAYVLGSMVGGGISVPSDGWKNSGVAVSGDGRRLVEWRVLDAQYFGVAQRRRRIFALLDVGAWWSRQPILFEQEGVRWDSSPSGVEGQGVASGAEGSSGESCFCLQGSMIGREEKNGPQGDGVNIDKAFTLNTIDRHAVAMKDEKAYSPGGFGGYQEGFGTLRSNGGDLGGGSETLVYENHANDSRVTRCEDTAAPTLSGRMGTGGGNVPFVLTPHQ